MCGGRRVCWYECTVLYVYVCVGRECGVDLWLSGVCVFMCVKKIHDIGKAWSPYMRLYG